MRDRKTGTYIKHIHFWGPTRNFIRVKLQEHMAVIKKQKYIGRMDCPAALRAIAKWGYVKDRVFFADEQTAIEAGFRPCAACQREKYKIWKSLQTNH